MRHRFFLIFVPAAVAEVVWEAAHPSMSPCKTVSSYYAGSYVFEGPV